MPLASPMALAPEVHDFGASFRVPHESPGARERGQASDTADSPRSRARASTGPLTRPMAEIDGDLSATRERLCIALQSGISSIDVIARKMHGTWTLAARSLDDPSQWPICTELAQIRVAVTDRVDTVAPPKPGKNPSPTVPPNHVVSSLLRQIDPLPHLTPVESITNRPVWSRGRWIGSEVGEFDPDSRTIVCLDPIGVQAQAGLTEVTARALASSDPAALRELARAAIRSLSAVSEGAAWLADCDRAAWLTTCVAASARAFWASAKGSPAPMLLCRSPDSGSGGGKSTLAHAVGEIAGRSVTLSTQGVSDSEVQYQLGPILGERIPVVICDEIGTQREAGVIDTVWHEVLTAQSITTRMVGTSRRVTTDVHSIFVATGIEPSYRGNTRRRVIAARLGGPADPSGAAARHGLDPLAYCRAHAAELWSACALVLWAYKQAKCPAVERVPARPSYEDYDLVRKAVVWADGGDCYARPADETIDDAALFAGTLLLEQVLGALTHAATDTIAYPHLAGAVGLRPTHRGDAARLATDVRRSAWPAGWRVVRRTRNGANHYAVETLDLRTKNWRVWVPGDPTPSGERANPSGEDSACQAHPSPATPAPVTTSKPIEQAGQPDVCALIRNGGTWACSAPGMPAAAWCPACMAAKDAGRILRPANTIDLDHKITISVGFGREDRSTTDPIRVETTVGELVKSLSTVVARKSERYICPGYRQDTADGESYPRRISTLESADILGFDFDDATPEQLVSLANTLIGWDVAHVFASTYSHAPQNPRARVFMFPRQPLDAATYRATWEKIANTIESVCGCVADHAPSHIASVLYFGHSETDGSSFVEFKPGVGVFSVHPSMPIRHVPFEAAYVADGRDRLDRVERYLERVPATHHTGDLYALICRIGDLAGDESKVREAIATWASRVNPTHSTGEAYTNRELERLIADAIRYRQTGIGSGS